ncbi:conserved exported hypothetical protein [Candidatus Methylobacter favarea]|uniref:Lipoprotein n=1 Tax=Candidatus Methylobacter favarea TaxID=2707345 RepID=A0A8S0Y9P2_9GAMM|nr:hypothetical protein [Candidatus Methylobacter favarea]CAA9890431.1 conserved exported hypothetical protein [Candidatus Methylobacter favarea]
MRIRNILSSRFVLFTAALLSGCATSRQIAIDHPAIQASPFQPLPGFQVIDGDDYYLRLISEFDFKGNSVLKSGCTNMTPSYEKSELSAALIYSVRNDILKFNSEAPGFLYQAGAGKCNFKFDAKKVYLTPWIRLNSGKQTMVDYNFYTNANSDLDVAGLVGDINAASNLLALTGVGMGVAIMGQVAGQWVKNNQQTATASASAAPAEPAKQPSVKHSSESHSLPAAASFSGKTGTLNQIVFKVYEVAEGGANLFSSNTQPLGELKIYPEILPSLLLKTNADGLPDARDLSMEEIGYSPIKSASGEINLQQLIEQAKHPAKPNLKPDWNNYEEMESNCRKLKVLMKDLGFNKFDRNAVIYYFLTKNNDWKNYNISPQKAMSDDIRPKIMAAYRSKDFSQCLASDDYAVMKAMGLAVNTPSDWNQISESGQKKEQFFTPLKSIERQLISVLKNPNITEMERQLYPLLITGKRGDGTVLLQNHLGDFGLETLLKPAIAASAPAVSAATTAVVTGTGPSTPASPVAMIPGEGIIVDAQQLAQVFAALSVSELSCARPAPDQLGKAANNVGILLFTLQENRSRVKGGAMEFEFSGGKISRISFQLPSHRDFEQDVLDHPETGGCRIDPSFLTKLH